MWHYKLLFFLILAMETYVSQQIEFDQLTKNVTSTGFGESVKKLKPGDTRNKEVAKKSSSFSEWSRWSACQGGHKTRRKHCLRRRICGEALRVEVARCDVTRENRRRHFPSEYSTERNLHTSKEYIQIQMPQLRQNEDIQSQFRGFSPWGPWSACSQKCTTVRRRYCQKWAICGDKVIRQSAYCYLDGSYCHLWIRNRMQRRKDPGEIAHRIFDSRNDAATCEGNSSGGYTHDASDAALRSPWTVPWSTRSDAYSYEGYASHYRRSPSPTREVAMAGCCA